MSFYYELPCRAPTMDDYPMPQAVTVHRRGFVRLWERPGVVCRLARLPSGMRVSSAIFTCDVVASLGLYRTVEDGGAPVAPDFFAKAQRADALKLEIETVLWRGLGMTEDPKCDFDLAATFADTADGEAQLIVTLYCDVPLPPVLARASREWVRLFGAEPRC